MRQRCACILRALALLGMLGLATGCQFKGGTAAGSSQQATPANRTNQTSAWRPVPVNVRIYPSTHFAKRDHQFLLLANIQLLDEMGDPVKGAGHLRCELFARSGNNQNAGQRLYSWDVNLLTLADQQRYYDPITRGYLLRLQLDSGAVMNELTLLRVTFLPVSGKRLQVQRDLPIKW